MTETLKITTKDTQWQPKFFAPIVGVFCALYMITLAVNTKFIDIYGMVLPMGILTFPLCAIITDILTEIYGFNRTRQAIWTVLFCTFLYTIFTQLAIMMPAPDFWPHQEIHAELFGTAPRLALAGMTAWVVGEFANTFIMSKMKIFQNAKYMPLRFIGSTIVGQFLDTIVFILIAFWGVIPNDALLIMLFSGWGLKVLYEVVALPLTVPLVNRMKCLEGVEHYDKQKISLV